MSWVDDKTHAELARVRDVRERQVYPFFRPFESGGLHTTVGGHAIVNFSSNDYLGLTNHPRVKEAARKAVDRYACGMSSSRIQATAIAHQRAVDVGVAWVAVIQPLPDDQEDFVDRIVSHCRHAFRLIAGSYRELIAQQLPGAAHPAPVNIVIIVSG